MLCLALAALPAACGARPPEVSAERRAWQGPGDFVFSSGVTTYDRREIAQKVPFPTCIRVADDRYRFVQVTTLPANSPTPPGLFDTMFYLDRWRLWAGPGPLIGQPAVFVTVRGSTGILGEYSRITDGEPCPV